MKKRNKKTITLILTIIIFIFLVENISKISFSEEEPKQDIQKTRYYFSENPLILFELTPNSYARSDSIKPNSEGLIDKEYSIIKPEGIIRIVAIGDSITEGVGTKFNESFVEVLEKELNERTNKSYEVINFGLSRYSSIQEIETLKTKALKYNPDIILWEYFLNDPAFEDPFVNYLKKVTSFKTDKLTLNMIDAPKNCYRDLNLKIFLNTLSEKSYFFKSIISQERDIGNLEFYKEIHENICYWKTVEYSFNELNKISKNNNITTIVTIFPILTSFFKYPLLEVNNQVYEEAQKNNFTIIDVLNLFKDYHPQDLIYQEGDNVHPNKLGHKLVAEELFNIISQI